MADIFQEWERVCKMKKQIRRQSKACKLLDMPCKLQPQCLCIFCFLYLTHPSSKNPHGALSHFTVAYAQMSPNERASLPSQCKIPSLTIILYSLIYFIFPHNTYHSLPDTSFIIYHFPSSSRMQAAREELYSFYLLLFPSTHNSSLYFLIVRSIADT